MPALGMPGAPIAAIMAVINTINCWVKFKSMPTKLAINSAAAASYKAVPSMLTVAPSGTTKPAISGLTCKCCVVQRMVTGSVAELELVANAVTKASLAPAQNHSGVLPVIKYNNNGKITTPCNSVVPTTTAINFASVPNIATSCVATSLMSSAAMPNGASRMTQPTISMVISKASCNSVKIFL